MDGKYFVNPGSLVRITNSLSELKRKPKVAIIKLDESIDIELVELRSALNGEDVLDRSEIENHIFKNEILYDFRQTIERAINFDKLEVNEILLEVSNAEGVSNEVKEEALRRISYSQMKYLGDDL